MAKTLAASQPHFSPKQIGLALGVSESTVKRWCDCGAISIAKTSGGHRKITVEALQCFLEKSQRCLLFPNQIGLPQILPSRPVGLEGKQDSRNQVFRDALACGDEASCRETLQAMINEGTSHSEAAEWLITDAMHGVGHAWDCRRLDVYQERRGCEIVMRLIYELRNSLPPVSQHAPVAIGGSPEGDPYQLPTALVELTLREAGWNATSLGNNLPLSSFAQAAADCRPEFVWMSVSVIDEIDSFASNQTAMADALGDEIALLLGGRALTDTVRQRLRYTAYCHSLRNLSALAMMLRAKHCLS